MGSGTFSNVFDDDYWSVTTLLWMCAGSADSEQVDGLCDCTDSADGIDNQFWVYAFLKVQDAWMNNQTRSMLQSLPDHGQDLEVLSGCGISTAAIASVRSLLENGGLTVFGSRLDLGFAVKIGIQGLVLERVWVFVRRPNVDFVVVPVRVGAEDSGGDWQALDVWTELRSAYTRLESSERDSRIVFHLQSLVSGIDFDMRVERTDLIDAHLPGSALRLPEQTGPRSYREMELTS